MNYTIRQSVELGHLALLVGREALNQSYAAMLGVAFSVRNRVHKPRYWGTDWCSVISHREAYSSMTNPGDPNLLKYADLGLKVWDQVMQAAEMAYNGAAQDPVDGATHYHSPMANPPAWATAPDTVFIKQIDAMKFYIAS